MQHCPVDSSHDYLPLIKGRVYSFSHHLESIVHHELSTFKPAFKSLCKKLGSDGHLDGSLSKLHLIITLP